MQRKKISEKQEKEIAKIVGGKVIPLSGGLKTASQWKGDINTETEKYECKITYSNSYQLKFSDLEKIRSHALKYNRDPIFLFEFAKGSYPGKYVCLFEKNNEPVIENKSITLTSVFLFLGRGEEEPLYRFKYKIKDIERGVSIYSFERYLKNVQ